MDLWGTRGDAGWKEVVTPLIPGDNGGHILTRVTLTAGTQDTAAPTVLTEVPSGWAIGTVHRQGMPAQIPSAAAFPRVLDPQEGLCQQPCAQLLPAEHLPESSPPSLRLSVLAVAACLLAVRAYLGKRNTASQEGVSSRSSPGSVGPGRALLSILGNWRPVIRVTKEVRCVHL